MIKQEPKSADASRRTLRVMVVEDHRDSAEACAQLLKLWGHCVCVALDGQTALERAATFLPDAFLIDLGLPQMDGIMLMQELRKRPSIGNSLMIAVTGYVDEEIRTRSVEAGFDTYLVKPVLPDALRGILASSAPASP